MWVLREDRVVVLAGLEVALEAADVVARVLVVRLVVGRISGKQVSCVPSFLALFLAQDFVVVLWRLLKVDQPLTVDVVLLRRSHAVADARGQVHCTDDHLCGALEVLSRRLVELLVQAARLRDDRLPAAERLLSRLSHRHLLGRYRAARPHTVLE